MACITPITIKSPETRWLAKCRRENRSYEYYRDHANQKRNLRFDPSPLCSTPFEYYENKIAPRFMQVPCGKCDGCQKLKVDRYFVRCYFEFLRCTQAKRGSVWFVTLTYGDDKLPRLKNGTPCFDKVHIQTFFKRFSRYYGLSYKYFYVTEFGGEFGRPHYHLLLFIEDFAPNQNNKFKLLEWIAKSWTKVEDRRSQYSSMNYLGLFDLQRVGCDLVDSTKLISYCCKYVCKQFGAMEFDKYCEENKIDIRYRRFHHASLGLGDCLLDYANKDCWDTGFVSIDGFKYTIPDYYRIKIMREHYFTFDNGDYCYRPSDFALIQSYNMCVRQVEELKQLAIVDRNFPSPPDWVYDPRLLEAFYCVFSTQIENRDIDPFTTDSDLVSSWQEYLIDVRRYYQSRYEASAKKWKDNLTKNYGEKIGLLRKT